jgi:hypothetical protein
MPSTGVTDDRWTWVALALAFSGTMMMLGAVLRGRSRRQEHTGEERV